MRLVTTILLLIACALPSLAQTPISGTSASRWTPCLPWVPDAYRSKTFAVTNDAGALVFTVEGKGTQIPFLLALHDDEISGDSRYLLVHYKAEGLDTTTPNYFLHGVEGTPGGRLYAWADEVVSDGQWHTLAVDLLAVWPQEPTSAIAFKIVVGDTGKAVLTVDRVSFSDDLPAGAKVAKVVQPPAASVVFDWRKVTFTPAPGWTQKPATDFSATLDGSAATFVVRGAARQMRWPLTLPTPVDLAATPYISFRYKATGTLAPTTYAIWLGDDPTGATGHSAAPVMPDALKADGEWHNFTARLGDSFKATQLAVGLDSAAEEATMTLDSITFSSSPPLWPIAAVLPYEARPSALTPGHDGLTVLPLNITGGHPSAFFQRRLEIADWFTGVRDANSARITVGGIPFDIAADPAKLPITGTSEMTALSLKLPTSAKEVYLLTAAMAPASEPWGIDSIHPRPQEYLTEPEKVVFEVRYTQGPPDFVLPLDVVTKKWGMKRGLSVCVVHPDPQRQPTDLLLHDRMETAGFAILGATVSTLAPRVTEPTWANLSYPTPPTAKLPPIEGYLSANGVSLAPVSLFDVEIAGKVIPPASWSIVSTTPLKPAGERYVVHCADPALTATVDCLPGDRNEILLRMNLHNDGPAPITATLRFPVLRDVRLGSAADTWYLSGKHGGIINSAPFATRDGLGDSHPLQMDGFFNPRTGLALACLTFDTVAQHHFINLSKASAGGSWSPEYPQRDLAPGATFAATEAALILREGDWRAIFDAYRDWLKTWYAAPKSKPWWEHTFSFLGCSAHYDTATDDPKARGDIQHLIDNARKYLGVCDYVHLYGWSASRKYGEWGDYDHYDETIGGLDYFRDNIARAQASGVAVGLYQDGFLNCGKGQFSGPHALDWAMKTADQKPEFIPEYDGYNECPDLPGWQDYLTSVYARVHRDFNTRGLYIDEYGCTDGRWLCQAKDHGHNGYEIPYAGEVAMLRKIRAAVGPDVALYTEYEGAEVERTIVDGCYGYQALWSVDQEPLSPSFIDLPRFAFPAFKKFQIIYYVATRAGNWWLLKYPFFNGESYCIGEPNLQSMDAASLAFQRRAVEVACAHRDAFSSHDVTPLVRTEQAGVFANSFATAHETVWTLYNANGRSVHGTLLTVKHVPGAKYEDAWEGRALQPSVSGGLAHLSLDLGPKAIGCIVQVRP
jgi:hypothetical protein